MLNGQLYIVAGTSCSAPIFASVAAIMNDQLISIGHSRLGFMNPLIYASSIVTFNDVTSGKSYFSPISPASLI